MELLQTNAQKFCLTQSLKQNIHLLQMTQLELIDYIEHEVDSNPCLIKKRKANSSINLNYPKINSLLEDLTMQAACILDSSELEKAKYIFGSLSEEGFFDKSKITHEILPILKKVQQLDPAGICAVNLKDSLLIQLSRKKKEKGLAYQIIENYFDDFLHRRWKKIAHNLQIPISSIAELVEKDLLQLYLRPAEKYLHETTVCPVPDICISSDLEVRLNYDYIPTIALNNQTSYFNKSFKVYKREAIHFIENLHKRDSLLLNIGKYLAKKEKQFFLGKSDIILLSAIKLAEFCNVHESTIHRCLRNKYLLYSNNIFPLKIFFKGQKIAESKLLDSLRRLVRTENKKKPLSDFQIMSELEKIGIKISRRTVAKYRNKLKIPNTNFRKII